MPFGPAAFLFLAMRFAIAIHHNKKRYELICELVESGEEFERWKVTRNEDRSRFTILISDRPKSKATRFNWTAEDGSAITNEILLGLIHWLEWHIHFHLNPGYAGVFRKDDFTID